MFPFENMVKELGYLYSGTNNTGDEIVEKIQVRQLLGSSRHSSNEIIDRFAVQLRLRRNRYLRWVQTTNETKIKFLFMIFLEITLLNFK
jgi:hypothetical protein